MNSILKSRKTAALLIIFTISILFLTLITSWLDYLAMSDLVKNGLYNSALNKKAVIETLIKQSNNKDSIISFLKKTYTHQSILGNSGNLVIAEQKSDSIHYLFVGNQKEYLKSSMISSHDNIGIPMQSAFSTKEGTIVGRDYRGIEVYAGFTYIKELKWGIVAKIDVKEILNPFVNDLFISVIIAIIIIIIGSIMLFRITNPMIIKLINSEVNFRNMIAGHSSIMILVDPETGAILYANAAAAKFYGYPLVTLMTMNIKAINTLHSKQLSDVLKTASKEESNKFIFTHRLADGTDSTVEVHSTPIDFENKKALFSIIHDITEKTKMEKEIIRNTAMLNKTGVMAKIGGWELDLETNKMFFSKEARIINEADPEEEFSLNQALGRIDPEYRLQFQTAVQEAIERGISFDIDVPMLTSKGRKIWARTQCSAELVNGRSAKLYGAFQDITERKQNEILLLESERNLLSKNQENEDVNLKLEVRNLELIKSNVQAEESGRLKSAFLQNMSHEIRTPLNGILGFSSLLQSEDISKEEIKEYTTVIQNCGHRLLETVGNILDISKIETGQIEVNSSVLSLNTVMNNLYNFFTLSAGIKGLKLDYVCSLVYEQSMVVSDESKIYQTISNLINNAIKFTKSGQIEFGYSIQNDEILFYVKDSGIGIPKEAKDRVFERFAQYNLAITRGYEGAGLGLSICKGFVDFLGGKIWFESEMDKGTEFYFTIPYNPSAAIKKISVEKNRTIDKDKNIKILIAEDEISSFEYLKLVLQNEKFIIFYADNGQDVIDIVKKENDIDLILMDIMMPVLNGIEATKIIKAIRPDLPIIAQTAYAFSSERDEILSNGCDDYISKPINKEKLMELIEKYV